jgi:NAD(P)-dependent dehydrogenase (short-subunit alcohol dehydrogenase family)
MSTHERFTTPFGFHTTASEVIEGVDLTGKRAIITGAASGIGVETARALASAGADVTLAVRNVEAGNRVAQEITANTGNPKVTAAPLELTDRASASSFTDAWQGPLHILVNNAGIMALPELRRTPEGWELQFATNYLGHFNLTLGLHDGRRRRAHRLPQLQWPPVLAGRLRGHPLRAPPLRGVGGLRPVQDRQRAAGSRSGQAVGRRRNHRQRGHARRHPHRPPAPPAGQHDA